MEMLITTNKGFKCRDCGRVLPAWLPAAKWPNGAMLLHHLGDMHPTEVGPYLTRMETEDIATVAAEAFEVVEGEGDRISYATAKGGRSDGACGPSPGRLTNR